VGAEGPLAEPGKGEPVPPVAVDTFQESLQNTGRLYGRILREQKAGVELLEIDIKASEHSTAGALLQVFALAALSGAVHALGELLAEHVKELAKHEFHASAIAETAAGEFTKYFAATVLEKAVEKAAEEIAEHDLTDAERFLKLQSIALERTADKSEDKFDLSITPEYHRLFARSPAEAAADLTALRASLTSTQESAVATQYDESLRQWYIHRARKELGTSPGGYGQDLGADLGARTKTGGPLIDVIRVKAEAARSPLAPLKIAGVTVTADVSLPERLNARPLAKLGLPYRLEFFVPSIPESADWYLAILGRNEAGKVFIAAEPAHGLPLVYEWLNRRHDHLAEPGDPRRASRGDALAAAAALLEQDVGKRSISDLKRG
jgi:hypothetical protein